MDIIVYTTADGKEYTSGDGTILVVGRPITFVTDRTAADVARWRFLRDKGYANMTADERAEWDAGNMKGSYNISDLNRVGGALNYLRDRLADVAYMTGAEFTAKENWTGADIPTTADLSHYLGMVNTIRCALARFATTPPTPSDVGSLDYQGANDIERILFDVDQLITNMLAARHYAGDLYSGEV